jgi:hypothetical protein
MNEVMLLTVGIVVLVVICYAESKGSVGWGRTPEEKGDK